MEIGMSHVRRKRRHGQGRPPSRASWAEDPPPAPQRRVTLTA